MSNKVTLPNQSVFEFYEGANTEQYTRLTGTNLNRAPKALKENTQLLALVCNGLAGFAADWDVNTTYMKSEPCKSGGVTYISLVDQNTGNSVDNRTYWEPIVGNIVDDTISESTTWSSERIQSEILAMAIALG